MIAQEVAKKYATALFLSVKEKGFLDQAEEQFLDLRKVLREDRSLMNFLTAPQIPEEAKAEMIRKVFGQRMDRIFLEFLLVLVDKHRAMYLVEIIDKFDELYKDEKGILTVRAITAVALSEFEETKLVANLTAKTGKKIDLRKRIDPTILGGVILMTRNEIIDGSVRFQLSQIRDQLAHVKVH
jgi:F-type H+-transporting ATPase subunit delta